MHLPKRFWLFSGFSISVISIVVNAVVISNISSESSDLKREYSYAKDRLTELSSSLFQAESKFDTYKVLHHLAYSLPKDRQSDARDDAMYMLSEYLANAYGAAADVPAIDLYEAKTVEMGGELDSLLKIRDIMNKMLAEKDPVKSKALSDQLDKVQDDFPAKTEIGKKLKQVRKTSEIEESTDTWLNWTLAILPTQKAFREETLASIKNQKAKVDKLEKQIRDLDGRSHNANFIGIALQMLGLLLVLGESVMGSKDEKAAE